MEMKYLLQFLPHLPTCFFGGAFWDALKSNFFGMHLPLLMPAVL